MRRIYKQIRTVEDMSLLNGIAFEEYLADMFRDFGYKVDATPKSGDYGADLIMTGDGKRIVVQAKQRAGAVGFDAVKEVHFAKDFYEADEAWVIATHGFTPQAIRAAKNTGVRLVSGAEVVRMIRENEEQSSFQADKPVSYIETTSKAESDNLLLTLSEVESDSSLFTISGIADDKLLQYHGQERNIVIPSNLGIRSIGSYAFGDPGSYAEWPQGFVDPVCDWASIESIVIPEGVTMIGYAAFRGCRSLRAIRLPSTLKGIGPAAFECCVSLRTIDLPPALEHIWQAAFKGCESLQEIELPQGIKSIESFAFRGCKNLGVLTLPSRESVVRVGSFAFSESGVRSLTLRGNYQLGSHCFERCSSLSSVNIESIQGEGRGTSEPLVSGGDCYGAAIGMVDLPDYAFEQCRNLKDVRLPNTLTTIGDSAFSKCDALRTIEMPEGVTEVGESAFSECSALASVRIPPGVEVISRSVFASCSTLSDVSLPKGVKSIGNYAFSHCSELTRVIIPISVEEIGSSAFMDCHALAYIAISPNVRVIRSEAFARCVALTNVALPEKLAVIEELAFSDCTQLKRAMLPASIEMVAPRAFEGCEALEEVCCAPSCRGTIYRSAFLGCPVIEMDDPIRTPPNTMTLVNDARFPKMFEGPSHKLRVLRFDARDSGARTEHLKGFLVVDRGAKGLNNLLNDCSNADEVGFWVELDEGCNRGYYAVKGATSACRYSEIFDGYLTPEENKCSSRNLSWYQTSILKGDFSAYLHNCHLIASPFIDGVLAAKLLDAYRARVTPLVEEFKRVQSDESGRGRKFEENKLAALDRLYYEVKAVNAAFESDAKKVSLDYTFYVSEYSASLGSGPTPSEKAAQVQASTKRAKSMAKPQRVESPSSLAAMGCGCLTMIISIAIVLLLAFMWLLVLL